MCLFRKSRRKRRFKKKNELSFAKTELVKLITRESMSMFSELMETEIMTGDKTQNFFRDKVSKTSKNMFKSVNEEYKHYCNYAFADEELYRKQLKRRNKALLWLKDYLLYTEDVERQLLRDKKANRIDKRILKKYYNIVRSDDSEFGVFNDFFNKYLEFEIKDNVSEDKLRIAQIEVEREKEKSKEEKPIKEKKLNKGQNNGEKKAKDKPSSNDVPAGQVSLFGGSQSSLKNQ